MNGNGLIPKNCPSCGSTLVIEGVHLVCKAKHCSERLIMQILHWVRVCEMEGLSESFVRILVAQKRISSIKDLYLLEEADFSGLDGFGSRKIENALSQISQSRDMSVRQFVVRLGVNGVGERAVEKLGINSLKDLWKIGPYGAIGESLCNFVAENAKFINDLVSVLSISEEVPKKKGVLNVCMTGTGPKPRKDLILEIEKMGHSFVDHVGKDTNILVCEDVNGSSGKLTKARKLGVKLVGYDSFFK